MRTCASPVSRNCNTHLQNGLWLNETAVILTVDVNGGLLRDRCVAVVSEAVLGVTHLHSPVVTAA